MNREQAITTTTSMLAKYGPHCPEGQALRIVLAEVESRTMARAIIQQQKAMLFARGQLLVRIGLRDAMGKVDALARKVGDVLTPEKIVALRDGAREIAAAFK